MKKFRRLLSSVLAALMVLSLSVPSLAAKNNGGRFKDVSENDYYYDAVRWAVKKGITTGKTETEFAPDEFCTRAQAVTFLWRAIGSPKPVSNAVSRFRDVPSGAYYRDAVSWTTDYEVVKGKSNTVFGSNDFCTRGQFATMLFRYNGGESMNPSATFSDVFPSAYYYDAVLWAADSGIANGVSTTEFKPNDVCTRAQVVTFLYRYSGSPVI